MDKHLVYFNSAVETIRKANEGKMDKLARAATAKDIAVVKALADDIEELNKIIQQAEALDARVQHILDGIQAGPMPPDRGDLARQLVIRVTDGMIRQNLLVLTPHVKTGQIHVGEQLTITTNPGGDTFQTDLVEAGKKLRERGRIAKFYRDAGVHPGQEIILREQTPGHWELTPLVRTRRQY